MPEGNGTQRDIGRIEGRLGAMEGDISEIKSSLNDLTKHQEVVNSYIDQQKGEKRIVAAVAGSVSAFAAGLATYFVKGNT